MGVMVKVFMCLCLFGATRPEDPGSWTACTFMDERVFVNTEGHHETEFRPREALLQFGEVGETPVNPHSLTFMVTASKVDLHSFTVGGSRDHLECEIRRYSTNGIQVRWPSQGSKIYDRWFTVSLKHPEDSFTLVGFLRHTPAQPLSGTDHYETVPPIEDREVVTTSASMVLHTRSAALKVGLGSDQKLHCQFAVDHRGPQFKAAWRVQHKGDWRELYSHESHSGAARGSGVSRTALATKGDATLAIPFVKISSEGKYICSVSVGFLEASLDILLHIFEPPRVRLSVGQELVLEADAEQKVVCEAEGYYPLDVEMEWYKEPPGSGGSGYRAGAPLPIRMHNILLSSHRQSREGTYALSAFFYYQARLEDSGCSFSCRVTHASLRTPVRKSFTLLVHESSSWMFYLSVGLTSLLFLIVIVKMVGLWYRAHQESRKSKPY